MKTIAKIMVGIGFAAIFTALGMYLSMTSDGKSTAETSTAFADKVEGEVDVLVVGFDSASLFSDLIAMDTKQAISKETDAATPEEADAIIFMLSEWSDISGLPWQSELSSVYEHASRKGGDTVAVSFYRSVDGQEKNFTFFNTRQYPDWTSDCYAALFLHTITESEDASFLPPSNCSI
ncbi:MAG: hypothetical protein AAF636_27920 [Pseudomonadota bacterium]